MELPVPNALRPGSMSVRRSMPVSTITSSSMRSIPQHFVSRASSTSTMTHSVNSHSEYHSSAASVSTSSAPPSPLPLPMAPAETGPPDLSERPKVLWKT